MGLLLTMWGYFSVGLLLSMLIIKLWSQMIRQVRNTLPEIPKAHEFLKSGVSKAHMPVIPDLKKLSQIRK